MEFASSHLDPTSSYIFMMAPTVAVEAIALLLLQIGDGPSDVLSEAES